MGASAYVVVDHRRIEDFELLREIIPEAASEIVQLEKGRMSGSLTHIAIADFSLSVGNFSLGVRSQGILSRRKMTFGILLDTSDKVLRMSHRMRPGDIGVTPPGMEHHGRYFGRTRFAAISIAPDEMSSFLAWEPALNDLEIWRNGALLRADPATTGFAVKRWNTMVSWIGEHGHELSIEAAGLWKRSLLELLAANIMRAYPLEASQRMTSALALVRKVEGFLDHVGSRPVHISELCAEFHVSRRTLHRAFDEILGVAPVAYLRHKRICAVYSLLKNADLRQTSVAKAAMQHGFIELGRFSQYYRTLFGEYPSETLGSRRQGMRSWARPVQPNVVRN